MCKIMKNMSICVIHTVKISILNIGFYRNPNIDNAALKYIVAAITNVCKEREEWENIYIYIYIYIYSITDTKQSLFIKLSK